MMDRTPKSNALAPPSPNPQIAPVPAFPDASHPASALSSYIASYMLRGCPGVGAAAASPHQRRHRSAGVLPIFLLLSTMASLASARAAVRGAASTATRTCRLLVFTHFPYTHSTYAQSIGRNRSTTKQTGGIGIAPCFLASGGAQGGGKRPLLGAAAAAAASQQPRAALHASAATRLAAAASHPYADPLFDDVPDRRWVDTLLIHTLLLALNWAQVGSPLPRPTTTRHNAPNQHMYAPPQRLVEPEVDQVRGRDPPAMGRRHGLPRPTVRH